MSEAVSKNERQWAGRTALCALLGLNPGQFDRDIAPRLPAGAIRRERGRVYVFGPALYQVFLEKRRTAPRESSDPWAERETRARARYAEFKLERAKAEFAASQGKLLEELVAGPLAALLDRFGGALGNAAELFCDSCRVVYEQTLEELERITREVASGGSGDSDLSRRRNATPRSGGHGTARNHADGGGSRVVLIGAGEARVREATAGTHTLGRPARRSEKKGARR